ncbi:MAG TPA: DUF523 and DUF1722 domain-containing protein [Nitrospiraceae bacterium]|nr:DUF523 and DUF1722 domain-containing protein [Nitrospiraceae bacterium]
MSQEHLIRIGISRCLLGDEVRFDGGHKRDPFLVEVLGRYVEWVPVCPEVEAGLGTPREAMRLVGEPEHPRLVTIRSNRDLTRPLAEFSSRRVRELEAEGLCGYVFKKDSPSCGIERVRLYNRHGMPGRTGAGVFARAFREHFPLTPIEEEGRLCDPLVRENFIERVFAYDRWQSLLSAGVTRRGLVSFHTIHKYLLLAHSATHYRSLGQIVAQADRYRPKELALRYGKLFMEALSVKATVRKHVNVLHHLVGHFKAHLDRVEKAELLSLIDDYHRGLVPLVVPLTLVKHYVARFEVPYVRDQIYLNPHPKELMLRNRV